MFMIFFIDIHKNSIIFYYIFFESHFINWAGSATLTVLVNMLSLVTLLS